MYVSLYAMTMLAPDMSPLAAPLAGNFSILLGRIEVTVPDVEPGTDYSLVREYSCASADPPIISFNCPYSIWRLG